MTKTKKTIIFPDLFSARDYQEFRPMAELLSALVGTEVKYEEIASYDYCFPDAIGGSNHYYAVMYIGRKPKMIAELNAEVESYENSEED